MQIMTADEVLQITLVLPVYTNVTMCRYRGAAVVEGAAEVIGEAEIALLEDHRRRCQCTHQQMHNGIDGIHVCSSL